MTTCLRSCDMNAIVDACKFTLDFPSHQLSYIGCFVNTRERLVCQEKTVTQVAQEHPE